MISNEYKKTKEYAMLNNTFSKKFNNGYYSPFGEFLAAPSGVCRLVKDNSWIVKHPRIKTRCFSDWLHVNSYEKSLEAAIQHLKAHINNLVTTYHRSLVSKIEHSDKKILTGHVGISVSKRNNKQGPSYRFVVSLGSKKHADFPRQLAYVYIGSEGEYVANYPRALREAVAIRAQMEKDYNEHFKFTV